MNQADPVHAAMRKPLRQVLLSGLLLAAPLLALANSPSAKAEWMFESTDEAWALQDASILGIESDGPGLLPQHTPRGHAWGFWAHAAGTDAQRAAQSFKESAAEVSQPTIAETVASPVPEPASYALLLAGAVAAIGFLVRRRRQD